MNCLHWMRHLWGAHVHEIFQRHMKCFSSVLLLACGRSKHTTNNQIQTKTDQNRNLPKTNPYKCEQLPCQHWLQSPLLPEVWSDLFWFDSWRACCFSLARLDTRWHQLSGIISQMIRAPSSPNRKQTRVRAQESSVYASEYNFREENTSNLKTVFFCTKSSLHNNFRETIHLCKFWTWKSDKSTTSFENEDSLLNQLECGYTLDLFTNDAHNCCRLHSWRPLKEK